LLRLLLFHAVNDGGLREAVAQARASGIAQMSQVALFKRLHSSGAWLAWLGAELARALREQPRLPQELRLRAIDSTTVQGPASKGTQWRVHYSLDLVDLNCDWLELTDAHGAELLERTRCNEAMYCWPIGIIYGPLGYARRSRRAPMLCCGYAGRTLRWSTAANIPFTLCNRPNGSGSAKSEYGQSSC
jgi:hypothetical protein